MDYVHVILMGGGHIVYKNVSMLTSERWLHIKDRLQGTIAIFPETRVVRAYHSVSATDNQGEGVERTVGL